MKFGFEQHAILSGLWWHSSSHHQLPRELVSFMIGNFCWTVCPNPVILTVWANIHLKGAFITKNGLWPLLLKISLLIAFFFVKDFAMTIFETLSRTLGWPNLFYHLILNLADFFSSTLQPQTGKLQGLLQLLWWWNQPKPLPQPSHGSLKSGDGWCQTS